MKRKITVILLCLLLMALPMLQVHAEESGPWHYEIKDGTAKIYGYYGDESGHVEIPETLNGYTVTEIGNSAFLGRAITSVTIPDSVTVIGDFSFAHCPNLKEVQISENVTFIDTGAFGDCKSLTGIWVDPKNWDYSSDDQGVLYSKNKMTLLQVPASFEGEFTVPEGVIDIGYGAFEGCDRLTAVTLADSVHSIGAYAFCDCSALAELAIPSRVEYIGNDAFASCPKLQQMSVAKENLHFTVDGNGNLCTADQSRIVYVPGAFAGDYVVPEGTRQIGADFMSNCDGLTSVQIPDGVTQIGHYAFAGCDNLQSVSIAESVSQIDAYTFEGCKSLEQVNLPRAVTHIKWGLFRGCRMLTQLPIHDAVQTIDDFAFAECYSLTDIVIPASVKFVGHYAFRDCRGLQNVYFLGDAPEFVNYENINGSFADTRATAYYHTGTEGWTEENKAKTGGYITWVELEHIVMEEGEEARCMVCGEHAQKNVEVSMPSTALESDDIWTPEEPSAAPESDDIWTPEEPSVAATFGYDASDGQPMPEAELIMPASDKLLVEEVPEARNPFIIISCVFLVLAAAGWGLFIKQRWFSKKSDA